MSLSLVRRFAVACTLTAIALAPATAAAASGPVIPTFSRALIYGIQHPGLDPAGSNDFACKPSAAHPRPVVLLHGSFANRFNSFAALAPAIAKQGYCVFAPDYGQGSLPGVNGTASIRASSQQVAAYVKTVLAATGASQVDLVGYSQGGLVARAYLKYDGGSNAADPSKNIVASVIGLSADNHGTTLGGRTALIDQYHLQPLVKLALGGSSVDQLAKSSFLTALNAGTETAPGVKYTMVATRTDEISSPYTDAYLTPAPAVHNVLLQRDCPLDLSDHFNVTYSPRTAWFVLKALDPAYRLRTPCSLRAPLL